METVTILGDIGFVVPSLLVALAMLTASRNGGAALRWGCAFAMAVGVTGVLKMLLRGSDLLPHFPSGHVAVAVAFHGGLAMLLLGAGRLRMFGFLTLALVGALVGWSRVELTEHTWIDVVGGFVIGWAALAVFGCLDRARLAGGAARAWLLAGVLVALPVGVLTHPWLGHDLRTIVE